MKTISDMLREIADRSELRDATIIRQAASALEIYKEARQQQAMKEFQKARDLFD